MYLNIFNSDRVRRDDMSVFNFRGKTAPLASLPGLQFNGELALEENGSKVNSALAGYFGVGYEFAELPWKPRLSIVLPASAAIGAGREPTRRSTRCFTARATGVPGSKAKSSAIGWRRAILGQPCSTNTKTDPSMSMSVMEANTPARRKVEFASEALMDD